MKLKLLIILLLTSLAARADFDLETEFEDFGDNEPTADSIPPLRGKNWVERLWHSGFHINDPRIDYPRFARFCLKVYNWGDQTFNSYNPNYVTATGKNWKVTLNTLGSTQTYGYLFKDTPGASDIDSRVHIRSNIGYDAGIHINFMAVSVGYTWNVNQLVNYNNAPRSTFTFSFTCARFAIELLQQQLEGNTWCDRFGTLNDGRSVHITLNNTRRRNFYIHGYYFLNHRHYAQAAPYCFSKYQLRSAGSWLFGPRYSREFLQIDFTDLPAHILEHAPQGLPLLNQFRFHCIEAQGGYAYNAALSHGWLFNITALAGLGYRRTIAAHAHLNFTEQVSTTADGRMAFTYNNRSFFASAQARANISFLFNASYSFEFSSQQAEIIVGCRF